MNHELREQANQRRKDNWFDVFFAIEALGVEEDLVKNALEVHLDKLSNVKNVLVYEKDFKETAKILNPMKDVTEAYSQIVFVKLFVKDLTTLLRVVMTYGPSSVEIMGPSRKEVDISEVQEVSNTLAGVVHQFAAAGIGGILITPEEKKT